MNDSIRTSVAARASTVVSLALVFAGLLTASASQAQQAAEKKKSIWDGVTFDLNLGAPKLKSGEFKVVGDAMAGYSAENFGVIARGSLFYYDVKTPTGFTQTVRDEVSGEAWYVSGKLQDKLRLELRGSGGASLYDTDYLANNNFYNPSSTMGRGMLHAGVRLMPDPTLNFQVLVGGGAQMESYNYLSTDPADKNWTADSDSWSFRGEGRLMAHWAFLPGILSTRLRGDGAYFSITRTDSYIGRQVVVASSQTFTFHQLELRGRLSVEIDAAALFGILPFVYGGIDHISMSADSGSSSLTVPSAGVGLNKPVW